MKSQFFFQCRTLREVKQAYKSQALKHHPDRGGDEETMKMLNFEYDQIINNPFFNFSGQSEGEKEAFIKFPEILEKIIGLDLVIEICGQWVWVSGNTYVHRKHLKECGFFFAPNKQMWYWRPVDYSSANRNPLPMEKIRSIYGSDSVKNNPQPQLEKQERSAV
jgi:curved DNA-binding protein CbpA